jgi:hypothetical protein
VNVQVEEELSCALSLELRKVVMKPLRDLPLECSVIADEQQVVSIVKEVFLCSKNFVNTIVTSILFGGLYVHQ